MRRIGKTQGGLSCIVSVIVQYCRCEAKITLYQLIFAEKLVISEETQYVGFQGCAPRLEYPLTASLINPNPLASLSSTPLKCLVAEHCQMQCDLNVSYDQQCKFFKSAKFFQSNHVIISNCTNLTKELIEDPKILFSLW